MAESQISKDSSIGKEDAPDSLKKSFPKQTIMLMVGSLIVGIVIGIIVALSLSTSGTLRDLSELAQNQAKWENLHITHYQMSLSLYGPFFTGASDRMPLKIEVKDDKVVSVRDAHGVVSDDIMNENGNVLTISGLFSYTYQTIWKRPSSLIISYDTVLRYPESVEMNPFVEPCCESLTAYKVTDFQILPP